MSTCHDGVRQASWLKKGAASHVFYHHVHVFTRQIIASQQVQISRLRTFLVCECVGFSQQC